jgi:multicomponent K+:H+ antiporter subunit G
MDVVLEILIALLLVSSGVFGFVGSYGLIKLRDSMQRLHAPTKATTLGVGSVLVASILYFVLTEQRLSFHEFLITLFLLLTAPVTANFIAKAYLARNVREESLPDTGSDYGWAIYDDAPERRK